jgi:thiosulfate/3-mercaptopyruvate sulfurtransferase
MRRVYVVAMCGLLVVSATLHAQDTRKREPFVSTAWMQQHLNDPSVRILATGNRASYDKGHIPGAAFIEHDDTLDAAAGSHQIRKPEALAQLFEAAGVSDGMHLVLYGDAPMTTGWIYTGLALIGQGPNVSMLDGSAEQWRRENRPLSTKPESHVRGHLTVRVPSNHAVTTPWVREHLRDPGVRLLDVRTPAEWQGGHLPGATLVEWQSLFADPQTLRWKRPDELRALFAAAGVAPGQEAITYCAVGMRASLMMWAANAVGIPARVYVGSWEEWHRSAGNPVDK